jgi:uncharacterized protein (TIGR02246 family)
MSDHADEQAIRTVIANWLDASTRGDYAALEPMMHPDVQFLTVGNEPMTRDSYREVFENVISTMKLEGTSDVREVQVEGDLAYAWAFISIGFKTAASDVHVERNGNVLSIFKRNAEGQWQLWRDANLMPR